MAETTIEPSPTREATRLIEPARTSPTANTPRRLVSSACGRRSVCQSPSRIEAGAAAHEAVLVERHAAAQPLGVRHRAEHQEDVGDRARLLLAGAAVAPGHLLEVAVAGEPDDLGLAVQRDRARGGDAADQVVGHRRRQARAAHQDVDVRRAAREKDRRLPGGVAAADHDHLLALAQAGFHRGGGVVDAVALEAVEVLQVELAVARAGGDHDRARAHPLAVVELERSTAGVAAQLHDTARHRERAPNFCACTCARPASAWPEMPVGKPR